MLLAAHHSRDTAAKQWSETRALALLGLGRLLRTAATSQAAPAFLAAEAAEASAEVDAGGAVGVRLGPAPWFTEVWRTSLALAAGAALQGSAEQEAALAGLGLLIGMCKLSAAKGLPQDPVPRTRYCLGCALLLPCEVLECQSNFYAKILCIILISFFAKEGEWFIDVS